MAAHYAVPLTDTRSRGPPCPWGRVPRLPPECRELHLLMVVGGELRDEAEVGDLCGGPAKLEDHDERAVVEEGSPLGRGRPTAQAGAEDEGEGQQDADGACGWAGWSVAGLSRTSQGSRDEDMEGGERETEAQMETSPACTQSRRSEGLQPGSPRLMAPGDKRGI